MRWYFTLEDIENFWRAFDETYPVLDASVFQARYIDIGKQPHHKSILPGSSKP
jgi:hypothetical protein